ncbi:hypothetical protein Acr_29g0000270 [Actinidia rufa]|uniref:Uncharacterized protein n=1 Tax=Actinidia rufa TaxID=165716 RepID=A0A7J0HD08_9ERIC|nr:hypothetical protein Acr_29g0000270 [Actinidia rufa]
MSSGLYGGGEDRGGGGKLRKPPARRPPSTPYYRLAANQSQTASQRPDGGWLSKLVDPACRLIPGGATRILPSIFSKSSSSAASVSEDHGLLPFLYVDAKNDYSVTMLRVTYVMTAVDQWDLIVMGTSNVSVLHAVKKNLDVGLTSTTREFQSVDNLTNSAEVRIPTLQTSNPAVRAILEHLDRNTPTSKEKSAGLQLATEWKKSSSSKTASFGFTDSREKGTNQLWPLPNQIKGQGTANMPFNSTGSESLKKPSFQPSGTMPILASISVDKPHLRQSIFPNYGFSFPITTSSGVLSEPPTPSIMPSILVSSPPESKDGPTIPIYSFWTKRSTPALVFSFPSTSTASTEDEASNIKFSFGLDSENRISFRSVGKDAICY